MYPTGSSFALLAIITCVGIDARSAEIKGKVTAVRDATAEIEVSPDRLPAIGDKLEIYVEIPGVGKATVASGKVASVEGPRVRAKIIDSTSEVVAGQLVVIQSSSPTARQTAKMSQHAITSSDPRDNRFPPWPTLSVGLPWLGVSQLVHDDRVMLVGVLADGPAGKAGLQSRDVILATNGNPLGSSWDSLHTRINSFRAGDRVSVEIERGGAPKVVEVSLEQIPPDGGVGRLHAAAEAGEGSAMAELGIRYLGGYPRRSYVEKDVPQGLVWLNRANDVNSAVGAFRLAGTYFGHDAAFEKNLAKAANLFERARSLSDSGDYDAVYNTATESLASLYKQGNGVPRDDAKAVALYRELANRNVRSGAYHLAEMYRVGQGVKKDASQALHWYNIAAQAGHASAQLQIGIMAYQGDGVSQNYQTAINWFKAAEKNGSTFAKYYLGESYHYGRGVTQDFAEAAAWYRKTAASALSGGTVGLAARLEASLFEQHGEELGYGPAEARREAIRLYRKAAKWDEEARKALQRLGVPIDAMLIAGWGEVHDPDGDCIVKDDTERVTITAPAGRHDLFAGNAAPHERNNAPRVTQQVAGDFVAQVKVTADWTLRSPLPNQQNTFAAGLVIVASPEHYLRHERILFRHRQLGTPSSFAPPIYDVDGQRQTAVTVVAPDYFQGQSTWLRMERRGQVVATFISHDGEQWQATETLTTQLPEMVHVGVHVINASGSPFTAKFDDYELHGSPRYQVGDTVVVIRNGLLRGAGQSVVAKVFPGLVLEVERFNGNQLMLTNSRPGWLDQSMVIPFDKSTINRLTKILSAKSEDAVLYRARGLVYGALGEFDNAEEQLSEALRLEPSASHFNDRGLIRWQQGEFDMSIADSSEALRLKENTISYNNRGLAYLDKHEYDDAIFDYSASLRLDPNNTFAYVGRSRAWMNKGEYDRAVEDINEALRLDPQFYKAWRSSAWLHATCPNEAFRNGPLALEEANKACELSGWKDAWSFNVLAAAYAETGNFAEAVRWQTKAADEVEERKRQEYQDRVQVYRQHQPYRDVIAN